MIMVFRRAVFLLRWWSVLACSVVHWYSWLRSLPIFVGLEKSVVMCYVLDIIQNVFSCLDLVSVVVLCVPYHFLLAVL